MSEPAVQISDLAFNWKAEEPILTIDSLTIDQGERVFIRGPSGSGKSTLLNLLGGMIKPSSGSLAVLGQNLVDMKVSQIDRLRAEQMGVIFQQFNLLPYLSVVDNVTLPCQLASQRKRNAIDTYGSIEEGAIALLSKLGLGDEKFLRRNVMALSTGQQQRVAVARALLGAPKIVLADEPTSALDTDLRDQFIHLLSELCEDFNTTLLFVSHDPTLQSYFKRVETLMPSERGGFSL